MTPAQLETVEGIFHAALDREPDEVGAFLKTACKGDEFLRDKVEALVASHQCAGSFIETSVASLAARIVEQREADLRVGQTIGHYRISKRIGTGGMGEVYLALDLTAGRQAALKLLPPRFTGDAERVQRFRQEARAVVGLNHPNILTVYEIGEADSTYYIASELIDGETLRERLLRGDMQLSEAVDVAIQVASALAVAHEAGIIHRDIKPENIMLRRDGYVKVLDFGIAKLVEQELPVTIARDEALSLAKTNLGSMLGTVRYMSPEQARGAAVDKGTDIWSLGVVLYEIAAGRAPFSGNTPGEVMNSILSRQPPPLTNHVAQVPGELQQIVSRTLHKERERRYQSAHELLDALKNFRRKLELKDELARAAVTPWLRWRRWPIALASITLLAALALVLPLFRNKTGPASSPSEKSIAVLPFENLSDEKETTYFAAGVQDEILSNLAKIADLKVISRTSANFYKSGDPRNMREIGQQLGVAHLLEGSVQRAGQHLRVNAQLIDARTDLHLWAQTYDRNVADAFAIQSEIARTIADQLRAKISPAEQAAITQPPTADLLANDLYLQALDLEFKLPLPQDYWLEAVRLLEKAVARDPQFVRAYCKLAEIHIAIYFSNEDHTPARRDLANVAIEKAARLQPDAGEVHLARARYLYHGFRDYDRARAELDLAQRTLPNDPTVYYWGANIDRRQGRFAEAVKKYKRAVELDPRNREFLLTAAVTYHSLRRYSEENRLAERQVNLSPRDYRARLWRAALPLDERADTQPLRRELDAICAEQPEEAPAISSILFRCAMYERDSAATARALAVMPPEGTGIGTNFNFPREWFAGLAARTFNDLETARTSFTAARAIVEKIVRDQPDYAPAWSLLGRIDAALGRKEDAIKEGRRACELLPIAKDAWAGPYYVKDLAVIYARTGESDLAIEQLALLVQKGLHYGELKLDPQWDSLRGDPRFQKIVASLAPQD